MLVNNGNEETGVQEVNLSSVHPTMTLGKEKGDEGADGIKHLNNLISSSCSASMFNKQHFDHNMTFHFN